MSKGTLVIVESPTKAKTIRKFLPKNYVVEASMGHVRDLPDSAANIPKAYKEKPWARLGVDVENDFEPLYVIPKGKSKIVTELRKKLKNADELLLATDEDREGESISWHLLQLLKPKVPVKRMVFHEITKSAIKNALSETREVDAKLVQAQETRRILDRLVGFTLSPLIWKKVAYGLSAGRVQSVGLKLLVDRERERIKFRASEYWSVDADLVKGAASSFQSKLHEWKGKRLAAGKDFDEYTGKLKNEKVLHLKEAEAKELEKSLVNENWVVDSVEEKPFQSHPTSPFITSTLQQEANRKIGMSSRETMRTAQRLYEQGLITYMRTDSPNLSKQAVAAARSCVEDLYGKNYLSEKPRQFAAKSKGAQEAHEAIRPAGETFVHPRESGMSGRELALYDLIWKKTVATQMASAKKVSTQVRIKAGDAVFAASGTQIEFPGFLRAYVEGNDDPEAALGDKEVLLPKLAKGDEVKADNVKAQDHVTKPKARFTEASLIKMLEAEGIGRPSTYASIIDTITNRGYVRREGNSLIATYTGFAVTQILEKHFSEFVDTGFTSSMENSLDEIASGEIEHLPYLKKFYSGKKGLLKQVEEKEKDIDPDDSRTIKLGQLNDSVQVKVGRFGPYITQDDVNATVPNDIAPADLTVEQAKEIIETAKEGPKSIGVDPETGKDVYILMGRFGPYAQLGEITEDEPKPKRASVPKGTSPGDVTLEMALKYLILPRTLGQHPETGNDILANKGRFGPYVMHDGDFRSLKKEDDVYEVTLARALEILAMEKKGRGSAKMIKDLGKDPDTEKKVAIYNGKYGDYVKFGSKNFTLPKDEKVEEFTLEKALALINAGKTTKKKKATKKKATKKKTTKKKASKKKTTKKKSTKKTSK
jgi:DNA topoisomerase-1